MKAETKTITKSMRLSPSLVERIKHETSDVSGSLSKKIRVLIELGLSENKDPIPAEERLKIIAELERQNKALLKLGTNINQIAFHLNVGDQIEHSKWLIEAQDLTQNIGEMRRLIHEVRERMIL